MNEKLLTIKEVSQLVGVSTQAIYQRIDKDLKPYLKEVDGKKYLFPAVLEQFNKAPAQAPLQAVDKEVDKQLSSALQAVIDTLKEQLEQKDRQIERLQGELMEQNTHVRKQSEKLVELVEQVNELQRNNQILLRAEQERNKPKELAEAPAENEAPASPVFNTEEKEKPAEGGFWYSLKQFFS